MELAPCPVKTIADGDDLIGEHCRLRDLDAIQGVIAGVVVDTRLIPAYRGHELFQKRWGHSLRSVIRERK
jgi:hypothetical protein